MCKNQVESIKNLNIWFSIFVGSGIFIRLFHFFHNRTLWMDEVYLSTSLIKMNYMELATKTLDYQQKAPIGFLWTVKTFVNLLGTGEMALRLFPLLCGIGSLLLLISVARYFLSSFASIIAISILALAPPLIFHAVEIKQYSTELFAALLVLYIYIRYHNQQSWPALLLWGLWGAIILWFSYSSVFILAGIATAVSCGNLYRRDWKLFYKQLAPFLLWLTAFAINYLLFTHKHAESKWIVQWFDFYHTFMPFPPASANDLRWYPAALYHLIDYPLGLKWKFYTGDSTLLKLLLVVPWLPFITLFYGTWSLMKERKYALLLLLPFLFVFLASGLKLYPLTERFWVFICPVLILLIAKGTDGISDFFTGRSAKIVLAIFLLAGPVYGSIVSLSYPDEFIIHKKSAERQALTYVSNNFKEGDLVYVYWNNLPGYRFYKNTHSYNFKAIEGKDYRKISNSYPDYLKHLQQDFREFKGKKRIWLIYNDYFHTDIGDEIDQPEWYYLKGINPTRRLTDYFSTLGKSQPVYTSFDVKVSLITLK